MVREEYSKSGNVGYVIDEDNRTITATLYCTCDDPYIMLDSKFKKYVAGHGFGPVAKMMNTDMSILSTAEYSGRAKCHPDDTFDVEFGKRLALLRAKDKYLRAVHARLEKISCWMVNLGVAISNIESNNYRQWMDNGAEIYQIEKETGLY